ncbi:MAG: cysteine hydrolase [Clostridium sp.]|jgi:nicotinamidase-related amidase|uniref:cysteine hydrolase family protein n=1 Tax=Clostridium sp. TaxID=1506 RepID=UPI0025C3C4D9|nr:cysteine hydrolase [Clostridium sp.]MCH3965531.1 cysteine hydrolase [Clostridium sp.]MCI1716860.1 cysteine hydrolase [Clostridium sp.]MCI1801210.1 cysteine hydrolase [Clostridium sp.]MCI1815046.1 cysteine hydrolase [Clostridium sp.]MCI1871947.1 cysteine hydrolase [Clostridium sp.]
MQNHKSKEALLVMDMQNGIISRFLQDEKVVLPFQKAVEAARRHLVPIIFVRVAFSQGYPEINFQNKSFSIISESSRMTVYDIAAQIHESLKPKPNEPIVTKFRVSAFTGSNLEIILRSQQIDTLVLSGAATSGVILSTLREASDKDYKLKVLSDACIDSDNEVHRILMEKIFPRQSDVLTVDSWTSTLN